MALYILYASLLGLLLLFAASEMAENCFGPLSQEGRLGFLWTAVLAMPAAVAWNEAWYAAGKPMLRRLGSFVLLLAFFWAAIIFTGTGPGNWQRASGDWHSFIWINGIAIS